MARMGNYQRHENRKPKKDAKKIAPAIDIITTSPEVEVIKTKGKKPKEGEEE
ncbi:MAG: hypothetical protein PHR43_00860 [Dehalococcoidales bacterium]|nr:hypothetical protein [Dehalococcoidales bacterium]